MYGYVIYSSEFQLSPWLLIHAGWRLFHRNEISTVLFDLFQYADICVICLIYRHMCNHSLLVSWLSPEKTVSWPQLSVLYVCLCTNGAWPLHWFIASWHNDMGHSSIISAWHCASQTNSENCTYVSFWQFSFHDTHSLIHHQPGIFLRPTQKTNRPKIKQNKTKKLESTQTHTLHYFIEVNLISTSKHEWFAVHMTSGQSPFPCLPVCWKLFHS